MNKNKKGQAGFVITVELLLIVVILVMGLVAGWTKVRDQTLAELSDTASGIGAMDQSYKVWGTQWLGPLAAAGIAAHAGFQFDDDVDNATLTAVGGDGVTIGYSSAPTATRTLDPTTFEVNVF